jgi:hypothetical protein
VPKLAEVISSGRRKLRRLAVAVVYIILLDIHVLRESSGAQPGSAGARNGEKVDESAEG